MECECTSGKQSFLSVVVPAKDEAASLPQLIDEIARRCDPCATAVRAGWPGSRSSSSMTRRPTGRRSVLKDLAADYPELREMVLAQGVGQSSATVAGTRGPPGATGSRRWTPTCRTTRPTWSGSGRPCPATTWRWAGGWIARIVWSRRVISRWANRVRNARAGPVDPRHRMLGPDLPPGGGAAPAGRSAACIGSSGRSCCARDAGWCRYRSAIGPGPHGRSHYNLWNRSLQVVVDLFGVAWLLRRPVRYRVVRACDAAGRRAARSPVRPARTGAMVRRTEPWPSASFWLTIGFLGQALFTARFLVQWMASERKRDSVVPVAFWWLSLLGGPRCSRTRSPGATR